MGKRHFLADLILGISRKYEVPVLDLVVFLFSFECLTNQQNANLKVPAACCIIPNACIFVSPLQDWKIFIEVMREIICMLVGCMPSPIKGL